MWTPAVRVMVIGVGTLIYNNVDLKISQKIINSFGTQEKKIWIPIASGLYRSAHTIGHYGLIIITRYRERVV